MHVRCPHCHNAIEFVEGSTLLGDVLCPSCGNNFSFIGGITETRHWPATDSSSQEATGELSIAHFQLIEKLGMGAFGTVWRATDLQLDRAVAIKIPRKGQLGPEESEQFLREARASAQLKHPNIVSVYEVGRQDGQVYIVSDFIDGETLADRIAREPLAPREAAELCTKVADALHHAHERGVIHRDLKPSNIMLDVRGEPHVMDFGLAKRDVGEITMTVEGQILGTPAYMSPEQAKGEAHEADCRSDIYSLGVMMFELLTGERPFRGNTQMLLHQIMYEDAPSPRRLNNNVPRDLETVCLKCLQKESQRRYQTAADVRAELGRYLNGKPILARPVSRLARGRRWVQRNPILSLLTAALVATVLLTTTLWLRSIAANKRAEVAGAIEVSSSDLVHARAIPATDLRSNYAKFLGWRVYVPRHSKYRLMIAVSFDVQAEFPTDAGLSLPLEFQPAETGKEVLLTLMFFQNQGKWYLKCGSRTIGIPPAFSTDLGAKNRRIVHQGSKTIVAKSRGDKVPLLRWETFDQNPNEDGTYSIDPTSYRGVAMVWIETVPDE